MSPSNQGGRTAMPTEGSGDPAAGRPGTGIPWRWNALDPVALYGPCRDGGLDKGTLAMTLSGLRGGREHCPSRLISVRAIAPYQVHHSAVADPNAILRRKQTADGTRRPRGPSVGVSVRYVADGERSTRLVSESAHHQHYKHRSRGRRGRSSSARGQRPPGRRTGRHGRMNPGGLFITHCPCWTSDSYLKNSGPYGVMPGRVCRHYLGSAATRAEGTDRHMEPDREDRSAGPACLRETRLRETRLRDEWCRRSVATGWRMPDDWESEAVGEVLAACRNRALARGDAGLAAVGATALAAACAGLGRSRARAGVGIAETIDDLVALFAVLAGS